VPGLQGLRALALRAFSTASCSKKRARRPRPRAARQQASARSVGWVCARSCRIGRASRCSPGCHRSISACAGSCWSVVHTCCRRGWPQWKRSCRRSICIVNRSARPHGRWAIRAAMWPYSSAAYRRPSCPTSIRPLRGFCSATATPCTSPRSQTSCGAAQLHVGDQHLARDLARRIIDALLKRDYLQIISNAGGCGATLKEEYAELLQDDPSDAGRAHVFSAKVRDVSEFLVAEGCEPPSGTVRARAAYADSCHSMRSATRPSCG
jgi:hypothetical protein